MRAAVTEAFAGIDRLVVRDVPKRRDLEEIVQLIEEGKLRSVVGDVFPLDAIRDAHVRMQSGHARGKIVVRP